MSGEEFAYGWINEVEAVIAKESPDGAWLLRAYLNKHEGRWVRSKHRRFGTEFNSPASYLVYLWSKPASSEAKARAWVESKPGEDYWVAHNRIAYEIATSPDYPKCDELDIVWKELFKKQGDSCAVIS